MLVAVEWRRHRHDGRRSGRDAVEIVEVVRVVVGLLILRLEGPDRGRAGRVEVAVRVAARAGARRRREGEPERSRSAGGVERSRRRANERFVDCRGRGFQVGRDGCGRGGGCRGRCRRRGEGSSCRRSASVMGPASVALPGLLRRVVRPLVVVVVVPVAVPVAVEVRAVRSFENLVVICLGRDTR